MIKLVLEKENQGVSFHSPVQFYLGVKRFQRKEIKKLGELLTVFFNGSRPNLVL